MTSYTATMSIKVTLLNWLANFLQIQSEIKSSRHGLTENLEQLICMLSLSIQHNVSSQQRLVTTLPKQHATTGLTPSSLLKAPCMHSIAVLCQKRRTKQQSLSPWNRLTPHLWHSQESKTKARSAPCDRLQVYGFRV